ncbi:MAG TPA: carboxypeptidase-like regulatory domain-containing protein, partial [Ignavibacteriales bacterium]|nr:carboxypeptidase-like regulatory domain-containing protein [Ignavibacteriales bacterium]
MGVFSTASNIAKIGIAAILIFLSGAAAANAQGTGSIAGTVVDGETGETLIGVNILIINTTNGTSTDLQGEYLLKELSAGTYSLKFSYVSYAPVTVNDITVKDNQTTKVDVQLRSESTELNEVVVSAEMLRSNENAMLKIQKNSLNIMDAVSAELISKNNSSDGADVLKRMTGVTISDGKYAFIRGVSDRYNSTMLNGASLPGTDPEKKSFSYDIIPSSMIENVITAKTFTADKPADFTGGLVQISTIEFPSKFLFNISASSSYVLETTGKNFVSYDGGKYDFLGMDDGTRDMPSIIPSGKLGSSDQSFTSEVTKSFKNNWDAKSAGNAPINSAFQMSVGDRYDFSGSTLGAIASVNYSNKYDISDYDIGSYTDDETRYTYAGQRYNNGILWGAIFNLSYKFMDNHKISLKNTYNQTTDNDVVVSEGYYGYTGQYRKTTALNFIERNLYSTQLTGEHVFPSLNSSSINWVANYGKSGREEPDGRRYSYWKDADNPVYTFLLDPSISTRLYSKLNDDIYGGSVDFTLKPFESKNLPDFKTGVFYDNRQREFDTRLFGFRNMPG